uniref:Uncharacterized protein n=1 Tax=Cyanistes caeruleus TaxID=156563 RepID=A0A8C0U4I1_CYACU
MGYGRSWVRALEMGNASAARMVWQGGNASEAGTAESEEHGEEQSYRHFTTTVQVVIFVGSLLDVMLLFLTCVQLNC